jgi:hypothetical protein
MVLPPKDWQKMEIIAISVAIGFLDLDKRKGLMSLLEGRNDMGRYNRQWRYKFRVNVT